MQITILSSGSRGDVQPYVALGAGLKAAGHQVRLVTHAPFEQFVTENGLLFAPLSGNPQAMLDGPHGKRLMEYGHIPARFFKLYARLYEEQTPIIAGEALEACRNADLIISTVNIFFIGEMVAEKLQTPLMFASLVPFAPSWKQPGMGSPKLPWWAEWLLVPFRHYHTMSVIGLQYFAGCFIEQMNKARQEVLGLPPRSRWISTRIFRDGPPFLYSYSQHVYPRPSDWSATQHVTGFWFLDRPTNWQPPAKLVEFLQAGPPPVCVGFGSMTPKSPEEMGRLIVQSVRLSGQRAIILSGWGGLRSETLDENLFVIDAVPHDWLFPQVSAVVHHGGAGTVAAGLRVGKPTVSVPFLGDHPFWGRCVHELGAGPKAISKHELTPEKLGEAIRQVVTNPSYRRCAEAVGEKIRAENGVQTAVAVIEREFRRLKDSNSTSRKS